MMVTGWALFGALAILGVWLFGIAHDWNVVAITIVALVVGLALLALMQYLGVVP
jgi:hypothetical protein